MFAFNYLLSLRKISLLCLCNFSRYALGIRNGHGVTETVYRGVWKNEAVVLMTDHSNT